MGAQLSLDKNDGSGGDFQELLPENHFKGFWSILLDKLGRKESDGRQGVEDQVLWHRRVFSIQVSQD